ncbi:flippase [Neobacillus niacini]|uniref:flippase n=1 Tax=Neobacillus niacini TaxID=86668 RepID=UPI0021CB6FB2|nr:flippase [Neobacillus niacini]MCM3763518.1 flippase [Neobacillus niacini]
MIKHGATMAKEKSLKVNFILNFIRVLMLIIFPLITFPYASRVLLPSGIGKVNFAISVVSYFLLFASLGINTYGIREAAKLRNDRSQLTKLVKELFTINLFFSILAYLLLFLALWLIPHFSGYRMLLLICSIQIVAAAIGVEWLYSALEEYTYITIRSIAFQILSLILLFTFVKDSGDYVNYAMITIIASSGSYILNFINSRKYINWFEKSKLDLKKHMKPILVIFSLNLSVNIYTNLDSVMLGFIKGDVAVGLYTAAVKIIKIVGMLITSLGAVLLPRLAFYLNENRESEFDELIKKSLNFVLLLSIPAVIGLSLLSRPIILIFSGEAYLPALIPMQILAPIILLTSISNLTGMQILVPSNRERLLVISVTASAITNFVLNLFFIPKYGVIGASIATLVAEILAMSLQIYFLREYFKGKKLFGYVYQYLIAGLCMAGVVWGVIQFVQGTFLQVLISVAAGAVTYGLICLLFKNPLLVGIFKRFSKAH